MAGHRFYLALLLHSLLLHPILHAQSEVFWNSTPETEPMTCHYIAIGSDDRLWCTDAEGIYYVDIEQNPPVANYRYFATGKLTSIWAAGSTILAVDAAVLSGENRLVRSSDNGDTWNVIPLSDFGVEPVLLRSDDAGQIFLGCTYATLLISPDSGKRWVRHTQFESLASRESMVPNSISGEPDDYVCTVIDFSRTSGGQVNRIFRHEGGSIWTDVSLKDQGGRLAEWETERIDRDLLVSVYFNWSNEPEMAISGDNGDTWHFPVGVNPRAPSYSNGPFLQYNSSSGRIYTSRRISSDRAVLVYSGDRGETFSDLAPDGELRSIVFGPDGTSWFVIGKSSSAPGVTVWKEADDGTEPDLVFDPSSAVRSWPLTSRKVTSIVSHPASRYGIWFASIDSSGVWRTDDHGKQWYPLPKSVWDTASVLYFAKDESVYSGSRYGIARLPHFNAQEWQPVVIGLGVRRIVAGLDRSVLAETDDGRLVHVDDAGIVEYAGLSDSASASGERIIASDQYNRVFSVDSGGLYVLRNLSPGWAEINSPVAPENILALASVDVRTIMLGTTTGVYRSDDLGESWLPAGLTGSEIHDLLFAKAQILREYNWIPRIVARLRDSLWSTVDTGRTWDNATSNLPPGPITAIATDPWQYTLLAAVQGAGIFWSNRQTLSSVDTDRELESGLLVRSVRGRRMLVTLPDVDVGIVPEVDVVDLLGRPVAGEIDWLRENSSWKGIWMAKSEFYGLVIVRLNQGSESTTAKVLLR